MLDLQDYIIVLFFGILGGFISGLLGVGGGILFIPALEFYLKKLGVEDADIVKFILANSLFVIIFSGIIITIKQIRLKNFYLKQVIITAIPGIISTLLVTYAIQKNWFEYNKSTFTIVFLSMLIPLVFRMFYSKKQIETESNQFPNGFKMGLIGIITGMVTSLSGLGGGIIMVPVFTNILHINIKKATSISTGVIPFFALANGILYMSANHIPAINNYQTGFIIYPLVIPLILGVLLTASLGVSTAKKMSALTLKLIFATMVSIIIIIKLLQYFQII